MENHSVKNGLFFGLASIAYTLIVYLVSPKMLFSGFTGLLVALVMTVIFMVMAAKAERADNEGFLSYGEALKTTFFVFVIGSLISTIFSYILYNIIDPSLIDLMKESAVETATKMAEFFGAPEDQLDQIREEVMNQDMSMGVGRMILQWVYSLIFGFIVSLIVSAVVKKNAPSY